MKYTHIYTGSDGISHFEDLDFPLTDTSATSQTSDVIKTTGVFVRTTLEAAYGPSLHNAPRRQYIAILEGRAEIISSDGTKRTFKASDIFLAEDLTGKGHQLHIFGSWRVLVIPVG